jgi:nitrogen PTS system EIIA component
MQILGELLSPAAVLANATVANKKALFQLLGQVAAEEYGLDSSQVSERLTERERLGSTGFGGGVAIPHGRIEGLNHIVGVFVLLAQPVDFSSVDDAPVDVVFCLLSPPDAGADHLKGLAQVSRWLRDAGFVAKLRGAASQDALVALFGALEAQEAA